MIFPRLQSSGIRTKNRDFNQNRFIDSLKLSITSKDLSGQQNPSEEKSTLAPISLKRFKISVSSLVIITS
jgi:hypothetical protein